MGKHKHVSERDILEIELLQAGHEVTRRVELAFAQTLRVNLPLPEVRLQELIATEDVELRSQTTRMSGGKKSQAVHSFHVALMPGKMRGLFKVSHVDRKRPSQIALNAIITIEMRAPK